mmetsp:Transcript_5042/g.16517  ORF Transcript_5042/g.16517 Transcript_5042/m.16517 type:complete len:134 (+) Transcript_5042:81-482(+)
MASPSLPIATEEELRCLPKPWFIVDARDQSEIDAKKGGAGALEGSVHLPLNIEGVPQSARPTTFEEFKAKLDASGIALPEDKAASIVAHCGRGGRGGRLTSYLRDLGYENVLNGGGPGHILQALDDDDTKQDG